MRGQRLTKSGAVGSIVLAGVLMAAVAWGVFVYATTRLTVYWNLGGNSHLHSYVHPALYVVAAASAVHGLTLGARSIRSPGQGRGRLLVAALVALVVLTVWACVSTLLGRAYLA